MRLPKGKALNMALQYKKRRDYKYTLAEPYLFETQWLNAPEVYTQYIQLNQHGQLQISAAYSWDGASGPMPDFHSIMRGSLVHDALYQLMREQHLDLSFRAAADQLLLNICRADGMNPLLAHWVHFCVRCFGQAQAQSDLIVLQFESPHSTDTITPLADFDKAGN
jgi:hypothetical protein